MPGHKRNKKFVPENLLDLDITEISEFDNLHKAEGIIKQSEDMTAKLIGADNSFFLINGSSAGIIASILTVCRPNDKIIVARNCHKSVYTGLILSQALPIYIMPEITPYGICGGISPSSLEHILKQHSDAKAIIITSPTYEGFCSNIENLAAIAHKRKIPLIVDEAHGSHFSFSTFFPKSALSCGADIVIQSWHKTMPVLTQTSVLSIKNNCDISIDLSRLKQSLSLIQSTSPSYIMMAVLDYCRDLFQKNDKKIFKDYTDCLSETIEFIKSETNLTLIGENLKGNFGIYDIDKSKIVINLKDKKGIDAEKFLEKNYNINIEMSGKDYIILMTSPADTIEGFNILKSATVGISKNINTFSDTVKFSESRSNDISCFTPITVMSPCKSFNSKSESLPLNDCIGLISAEFIIPYPPGIPIIVPGELISYETIQKIQLFKENGISIIGVEDLKIENLKIHFDA